MAKRWSSPPDNTSSYDSIIIMHLDRYIYLYLSIYSNAPWTTIYRHYNMYATTLSYETVQLTYIPILNMHQIQFCHIVLQFPVFFFTATLDHFKHFAFHGFWNAIDKLRLDNRFQVILDSCRGFREAYVYIYLCIYICIYIDDRSIDRFFIRIISSYL